MAVRRRTRWERLSILFSGPFKDDFFIGNDHSDDDQPLSASAEISKNQENPVVTAVVATTTVKKLTNVNLSRERPRNGPEILNVGSQLKITGRTMRCYICNLVYPPAEKTKRKQTHFCCSNCEKPVCKTEHSQRLCTPCVQGMFPNIQ